MLRHKEQRKLGMNEKLCHQRSSGKLASQAEIECDVKLIYIMIVKRRNTDFFLRWVGQVDVRAILLT